MPKQSGLAGIVVAQRIWRNLSISVQRPVNRELSTDPGGACGGFVLLWTDPRKAHATDCTFKVAGQAQVTNNNPNRVKDYHQLVGAEEGILDIEEEAYGYDEDEISPAEAEEHELMKQTILMLP